jgi:hypothetical protein
MPCRLVIACLVNGMPDRRDLPISRLPGSVQLRITPRRLVSPRSRSCSGSCSPLPDMPSLAALSPQRCASLPQRHAFPRACQTRADPPWLVNRLPQPDWPRLAMPCRVRTRAQHLPSRLKHALVRPHPGQALASPTSHGAPRTRHASGHTEPTGPARRPLAPNHRHAMLAFLPCPPMPGPSQAGPARPAEAQFVPCPTKPS